DERGVEGDVVRFEILAVAALDRARRVGHAGHRVEHGARRPQVALAVVHFAALPEDADHGLRAGEVSRAQEHDHAIALALEYRHLAELRHVVEPRVGARVGRENHALVEKDADAVSHGAYSIYSRTPPAASRRPR